MKTIIIDVRTPKEFNEVSYPGSINIPSANNDLSSYAEFKNDHIALVCFSGNRASQVQSMLIQEGYSNVTLMQNQMAHLTEGKGTMNHGWTVDRQFRLTLGIFIGLFFISSYIIESIYADGILWILFTGLIYSAISDNCYLKTFLASLPWNKQIEKNIIIQPKFEPA